MFILKKNENMKFENFEEKENRRYLGQVTSHKIWPGSLQWFLNKVNGQMDDGCPRHDSCSANSQAELKKS